MTIEQWFNVLNEAAAIGCRQVQFIGGEPTLHPHLIDMILFAVKKKYELIEIFTNATVIDDSLLATLKENGVHVACSFYSDEPAIHDAITHHHGSFARTVTNITRLLGAGISVRVGIIETGLNVGHAVRAEQLLREIGVSEISVDTQRKVGRGKASLKIQNPYLELCGECSSGKLCVTASGETFPCVFSRFAALGIVNSGIANILSSTALCEFRKQLNTAFAKEKQHIEADPKKKRYDVVCAPDLICSPDRQCAPNCVPGSSKCMPSLCSPSTRCMPTRRYAEEIR